jgi:hypothetical protein
MEVYRVEVAKINILVEEMKAAVTGMPVLGLGGDKIGKEKGIIAELNAEIGKLEIQLQNEIASNNANAQATAILIERKKGLIFQIQREAELLKNIYNLPMKTPKGGVQVTGAEIPGRPITPVTNGPAPNNAKMDNSLADNLELIENKLNEISSTGLGNFFNSFKNAFAGIADFAKQAADGFKKGFTSAFAAVAQVASSIVSAISDIWKQGTDQQMQANEEYYAKEKENIENSYMSQDQKQKALEKLDKNYEKKRKELMREQAKDAKATAIMQAIIAGALAVVTALSAGPIIGEVLAVIVGALAAIQIGLIASQPLPALAEGGLASAPTMAVVGDNPNANIDPEVISPLSKLKGMMKDTSEIMVYGVLKGSDIFLSSEKGGMKLARVRGY